jgi:DNA polymerase-3 subunit alpha
MIYQEVYRHSLTLEGLTRQTGIHAAGVIIADKAIEDYAPLYSDADGTICVQYEGKVLEEHCGLIKMDFLGLKNLTIIDNTLALIRKTRNEDIDIENIPMDDEKTFDLLSAGNSMGVFQFESAGMRKYLKSLKPTSIHDLIAMNAMYRPGPLSWIPVYIDKKHNRETEFTTEEDAENFKRLESLLAKNSKLKAILEPTNLIPIYQEQIMQIGQQYSGFTLGEADLMRRAMGKKKIDVLKDIKEKFLNGAEEHGNTKDDADFLFEKIIMPFAGYGFNKSHAACYALIAYQTAYLKANYSECFMTALLNSEIENTDKIKQYIDDSKQLGISILPPDINKSKLDFSIINKKILYGLAAIKGVAGAAGGAIIDERNTNGPYSSFFEFLRRLEGTKVNKQVIERLIKSGVYESFGMDAEKLMTAYPKAAQRVEQEARIKQGGQTTFFEESQTQADSNTDEDIINEVLKMPVNRQVLKEFEKEALGFNIRFDPLAKVIKQISAASTLSIDKKDMWPDAHDVKITGAVSAIREIETKKGDQMAFVTIDGGKGTVDAVVFPRLYQKIGGKENDFLKVETLLTITGKTQNNERGVSVLANKIETFDPKKISMQKIYHQLHIQFKESQISKVELKNLRDMLHSFYGGECKVFLHFNNEHNKSVVLQAGDALTVIPGEKLKTRLLNASFIKKIWFS